MKTFPNFKFFATIVAAIVMAFCNTTAFGQDFTAQASGLEIIPGQFIVKMKSDPNGADLSMAGAESAERPTGDVAASVSGKRTSNLSKISKAQTKGGVAKNNVMHEYSSAMVGFSAKLSADQVKKLKQDPDVEGVYPDYVIKLSPQAGEPNPPAAAGQTTPCGITKAGGFVDGAAKPTWIWILDTGIDGGHPDLNVQTNALYAVSFISGQSAIVDGNSHGTHCAGTAAAKNNGIGVVGVSAGAKVVPVKVLSNAGSGSFSGIIAGLNHVASKKIAGDVVSMSIGSYGWANCENANPVLRDVIRNLGNAGVWVVMAAGNDADANGTAKNLPGCINGNRVLTVGSITCQNTCSSFSNFGIGTDWVAVGSNVYSTIPGGGYGYKSGTSMATPTVAGICHARNNYPVSAGNITCGGRVYPIARR